jgi:hypothetical protein
MNFSTKARNSYRVLPEIQATMFVPVPNGSIDLKIFIVLLIKTH